MNMKQFEEIVKSAKKTNRDIIVYRKRADYKDLEKVVVSYRDLPTLLERYLGTYSNDLTSNVTDAHVVDVRILEISNAGNHPQIGGVL